MNRWLFLAGLGAAGYAAFRAMRPRYDFRDRHVVITGGSRGLGLVIARELAAAGARISICSRDGNELLRAEHDLTERGARVFASECDVTDSARADEFVAVATQRNGPIDVLINNAGVIRVGPVEVMRREDYEQSLQTHFWGPFNTITAVLPQMRARREGRIVNISSIGGKIAVPHLLPYSAGKFALVGFSDGLRAELAKDGIVVTTVCPGLMRTGSPLNAEFKGRNDEEYAWFALGDSLPGFSMSAESAARRILAAGARGDAEAVLGLPAKLAVAIRGLCPNLMSSALALVNRLVLPSPGGIGTAVARGSESRGRLPEFTTVLTDKAAARNNELHAAPVPPPLPTNL